MNLFLENVLELPNVKLKHFFQEKICLVKTNEKKQKEKEKVVK